MCVCTYYACMTTCMYVCIYYCMCVIMVVCMYRIQYKAKPEQDVFVNEICDKTIHSCYAVSYAYPLIGQSPVTFFPPCFV